MLIVGLFRDIAGERPEEIRELVEDENTHAAVKVAAIDALSNSGDYSLVPLISELAMKADPCGEELPRYLRALGDFGHPAAAKAIEYGLASEAWWVRAAAAQSAGRIGLTGTANRLVSLLDDPQWWVRFRAGEALVAVGEEGQRLLRETSRGGSELAATAARLTLAEQGLDP
jgi:HEAT repeat protein